MKYIISSKNPQLSAYNYLRTIIWTQRPIDDIIRQLRKASYNPDIMSDTRLYAKIIQRIVEVVSSLDEEVQKKPYIIEIKKVVIEYTKTMYQNGQVAHFQIPLTETEAWSLYDKGGKTGEDKTSEDGD